MTTTSAVPEDFVEGLEGVVAFTTEIDRRGAEERLRDDDSDACDEQHGERRR